MLSMNNKLIIFAKRPAWKSYAGNTYCHVRTCCNNYKHLVQAFGYSTTSCDVEKDHAQSHIDPRVMALREKLIYCDYLDRHKLKFGHMKRFLMQKKIEIAKREARVSRLINTPVYSVLLDTKADAANDDNQTREDRTVEEEECESPKVDVTRPVHMPYASTDQYSNVATSTRDKGDFDEMIIPLNEKYKVLYEKYLEAKSVVLGRGEDLDLKEYLEEADSSADDTASSYRTDLSRVPFNWMVDYEQYDDTSEKETWHRNYGTPDPNSSVSSVPCGGCGALLHCKDHAIPGYLPSEIFLNRSEQELRAMICQRCHFLKYYNAMLEVKVSADEYPRLLKVIKTKKCAVILMVDLTDFPCSIWPEIKSVLHPRTAVFVVGNKVDLLPQDSKHFFAHVKECLSKAVESTGIRKECIRHVELVSAKTGYGVEKLINKLHSIWKHKGDVYVIGCTNVGKSSLFNILLQSDYCKVRAVDLVQRATTSPWPGTTLRLLKFPILNPLKWRLYWRMMRLRKEAGHEEAEERLRLEQFKSTRNLKFATLQGHIGRTFLPKTMTQERKDPFVEGRYNKREKVAQKFGLDEDHVDYKYSRWCYDTPGTIQPDQILDLLTTEELLSVLPKKIITPRTFILRVNQTIFLAGLGRLDYLEGNDSIRCTIFSSSELPVTLIHTVDAASIYNELLGTEVFVVPESNPNRSKHWPALGSKDMEVTCIGKNTSIADVVLSSTGWIAIAGAEGEHVALRAWSPQGRGLHLRTPALLPKSVALHGTRVADAPAYRDGRKAYKR